MISRIRLRGTSLWVWLFIALAAAWVALSVVSVSSVDIESVYAAFVAATPALFAAALMYVGPHERRIQVAAFCFALPVAVNALLGAGILIVSRSLGTAFDYMGPRLVSADDAFSVVGWVFPIVAVFALASYIDTPLTRRGWLIIGFSVFLAVVGAVLVATTFPPGLPLDSALAGLLKQTVWIAWGYLLAVALPPRMRFLAVSAAANLLSGVLSLASFAYIQATGGDTSGPLTQVLLPVLWVLGVVSWSALIIGILRELPRLTTAPEETSRAARAAMGVSR